MLQPEENESLKRVYYIDFGESCSFMSISDQETYGRDISKWPRVTKERSAQKLGMLKSGRPLVVDKYKAAQAYAAMIDVGESVACKAAGRWLLTDGITASWAYECMIRKMLHCVSDEDETIMAAQERPKFCLTKQKALTEKELEDWEFGTREANKSVTAEVTATVANAGGGWAVTCTGGRAMGFNSGDYDYVVYNIRGEANYEHLVQRLSLMAPSGRTKLIPMKQGMLMNIQDKKVGDETVEIDLMIVNTGPMALARVARSGLFFETLMYKGLKLFFCAVKNRGKNCGVVKPKEGRINSWTIMLTALEYLIIESFVSVERDKPLCMQIPKIYKSIDGSAVTFECRNYFLWLAENLADPNKVLFSLNEAKWDKRASTEYATSLSTRICRDPFSVEIDNSLRTLEAGKVMDVIQECKHAAYCLSDKKHVSVLTSVVDRCQETMSILLERLLMIENDTESAQGAIAQVSCPIGYCFKNTITGAYGISKHEVDARIRAVRNTPFSFKEDASVAFSKAVLDEVGRKMSAEWLVNHGLLRRLHFLVDEEVGDAVMYVGSCSCDPDFCEIGQLCPIDVRAIEILLQWLDQRGRV